MNDTATPRTDAVDDPMRAPIVRVLQLLDHARQLERELASIGEFQDSVRELLLKLSGAPSDAIDGKGSDAGWEEFTLAEIGQGFAFLQDQHDEKIATLERELAEAKAKLEKFESLDRPPDRVMLKLISRADQLPEPGIEVLAEYDGEFFPAIRTSTGFWVSDGKVKNVCRWAHWPKIPKTPPNPMTV